MGPNRHSLFAVLFAGCLAAVAARARVIRVWKDYPTIQAAVNAAETNDTILVSAGNYPEQVVVNKPLTIEGSGSETNGTIVSGTSGTGMRISASATPGSPMRVRRLRISGFQYGISSDGTRNLAIDDVCLTDIASRGWLVGNVTNVSMRDSEIRDSANGIWIGGFDEVDGFELHGCSLHGNNIALYSQAKPYASNHFQNVTVSDTSFTENRNKGMYLEKLHRARFENVVVDHSGWDATYDWAAGVDVNLKYRTDYSDLVFTNVRVMNCGLGANNGVGIAIKARDDGGYSNPRAALSNVTVVASVFTNNETAIRFGETGKTNAGPMNVNVTFSTILGSRAYGILNVALSAVTATNIWWGTTNAGEIAEAVYDRGDDPVKGLVTVEPVNAGYGVDIHVTGCGTVSNAPILERYGPMMALSLEAFPCEGWLFDGWSNGITGMGPATNIAIAGDLLIEAPFSLYKPPPTLLWLK